jgi:hypothetical protein
MSDDDSNLPKKIRNVYDKAGLEMVALGKDDIAALIAITQQADAKGEDVAGALRVFVEKLRTRANG